MQTAARRVLCLLAACLWMGQSHAEPLLVKEPLAPLQLSLDEAVRRAEEYVPALVRARNDALITAAKKAGAALLLSQNPYASFLGGYRPETTGLMSI